MADSPYHLIYSTHPSLEQAREAARMLLDGHLAACCNIIPAVESHYRWEGKLTQTSEVAMVCKTTIACLAKAMALIRDLHPYDTPAIVSIAINTGDPGFLDWVAGACANDKT